ncbi:hypothetical protein FACS1894184_15660 [Clostridia bacterium]|nr:hypothetical protein FACS1894184_15660 [Clostridia bacterium]
MQIILLSGGSGKRLWPLSSNERPKQFIKILPAPDGSYESMVQRVYRQIREAGIDDPITIATSASQVSLIREQLGMDIEIVQEPSRRDTFPAIALSCSYLFYEKGISRDEVVAVQPIDPYCELYYFLTIKQMEQAARWSSSDIVLMGIVPKEPSEKYGYIVPQYEVKANSSAPVDRFVEKPNKDKADSLIKEGALWNGGVFVFKLGYMLDLIHRTIKITSFKEALDKYDRLEKTSFDYAVVEKASRVQVVKYSGYWEDLGTWGALSERISPSTIGNVTIDEGNENTQIINELSIPIVALGVKNLVVVASKDGILLTTHEDSSELKTYVDKVG